MLRALIDALRPSPAAAEAPAATRIICTNAPEPPDVASDGFGYYLKPGIAGLSPDGSGFPIVVVDGRVGLGA